MQCPSQKPAAALTLPKGPNADYQEPHQENASCSTILKYMSSMGIVHRNETEFLQQTQPRAALRSPRLLWGQDTKPRSCWWKPNPILAICKFFCMESVGFQQKERRNDERGLHSSPSRNESFSLIHNYQMAKQIPRGRWILRLIFLLHMFNKVNKDCEEIYVTQRRFSQHTKIQEWI